MSTTHPTNPSPWIFNARRDLLLIVASPLLILPALLLAGRSWSVNEISLCVLAFGSLGHHLPGMIRAYGDRELFMRYRVRFIAAPLFLVGVCLFCVIRNLSGLILISICWGIWHALMQTFGFVRIYDAKAGGSGRPTARIDFWMCLTWFVGAVLISRDRFVMLLELYYRAGGPRIPADVFELVRTGWMTLTLGVTCVFVADLCRRLVRREPVSGVKLVLLAISISFYWYTNILLGNLLLGLAMFELFHDVQYLAIVWFINRNRVEKNAPATGRFIAFLFRRSGTLIGIYIGLIAAYGSLRLVEHSLAEGVVLRDALTALLAASGLLHFYYDGFIWKVRERATQTSLGLDQRSTVSSPVASQSNRAWPAWATQGLKWSAFMLPLMLLALGEAVNDVTERDLLQAVITTVPGHAGSQEQLGYLHQHDGDDEQAERHYKLAIRASPDRFMALNNLGSLEKGRGNLSAAELYFERAIAANPEYAEAYSNLGGLRIANGQYAAAIDVLQRAMEIHPGHIEAINNLGIARAASGDVAAAESCFRQVLRDDPQHATAHYNLALTLSRRGRTQDAVAEYRTSIEIDPGNATAHNNLANLLVELGQVDEAISHYKVALAVQPNFRSAQINLRRVLGRHGK